MPGRRWAEPWPTAALGVQGWCRGLRRGGTRRAARVGWLRLGTRHAGVLVLSRAACEQGV